MMFGKIFNPQITQITQNKTESQKAQYEIKA